jgi:hypothetical protein
MYGDVLSFAPAALVHRIWTLAGTMRSLADTFERSARVIDRASLLAARSRRLERAVQAGACQRRRREVPGR